MFPRYFALIPAAGVGSRMQADCPKQYLSIAGQVMLRHTLQAFLNHPAITHTFVVVSQDDGYIDQVFPDHIPNMTVLRYGGKTRKESVQNGLQAMRSLADIQANDWVLVHDAARPGLTVALIDRLIEGVGEEKEEEEKTIGGLLALPVVDTVKKVDGQQVTTIPRTSLWLAQTPQMFSYALLHRALDAISDATDEASAVEALGFAPKLVEGHPCNSKITRQEDFELVELFLGAVRRTNII